MAVSEPLGFAALESQESSKGFKTAGTREASKELMAANG